MTAPRSAAYGFRYALDAYIDARMEYKRAREAHGDNYEWDYYGRHHIEAMERANTLLDAALEEAVRAIVA